MVYLYDQDIKVKQVASEKILKKSLEKNFLTLDESLCFYSYSVSNKTDSYHPNDSRCEWYIFMAKT